MNRYGGNTSCVQVTLASGETLILDAGTGIRTLGLDLPGAARIHILLTHLHLDHIQGLMFFAPCFRAGVEITIWGPASPEASLEDRIARYISAPLSPVEVRELPCSVAFRDTPATEWEIGGATIRAEAVTHRGPTLGYRITDGDTTARLHPRPRAGARRRRSSGLEPEWISGFDLAKRRRPADPRLPVHRRRVPRPRRLGALGAHRHAHVRAPRRGASTCCSSTTTRCTPTTSSTTSTTRRPGAGRELGGDAGAIAMGVEGGELTVGAARRSQAVHA